MSPIILYCIDMSFNISSLTKVDIDISVWNKKNVQVNRVHEMLPMLSNLSYHISYHLLSQSHLYTLREDQMSVQIIQVSVEFNNLSKNKNTYSNFEI